MDSIIRAKDLLKKYNMKVHSENGSFLELNEKDEINGRHIHGYIYYYINENEKTKFHRIDCDEYWCYNCGTSIEIWVIDEKGSVCVKKMGLEGDCEQSILLKKGSIFASKNVGDGSDGTFITCITVPRFSYEFFELFDDEYIKSQYPQVIEFYK